MKLMHIYSRNMMLCIGFLTVIVVKGLSQDPFILLNPSTNFFLNKSYDDHEDVQNIIADNNVIFSDFLKWIVLYDNITLCEVNEPATIPHLTEFYTPLLETSNKIPIGILNFDIDYLNADSIDFYLTPDSLVVSDAPLEIVQVFAISNLRESLNFKEVIFEIDTSKFFTNRSDTIIGLEVDFGDGNGNQFFPFSNTEIAIEYANYGEKSISYTLLTESDTLTSFSKIVLIESINASSKDTLDFVLDNGSTSSAYINTYLGCDSLLNKPVIVVQGFRTEKYGSPDNLINRYASAEIWKELSENGYDFIGVGFEDTHDYIQNNAEILSKVIHHINNQKAGHFENVLIGESMGGLISRIALRQMELDSQDHEVRLYVSFDSPHRGASAPLSIQETIHDALNVDTDCGLLSILGGATGNITTFLIALIAEEFLEELINDAITNGVEGEINDPLELLGESNNALSSLQMQIRHRLYANNINPEYIDFQDYLFDLGFPEKHLRSITLINGANTNTSQTHTDDNGILDEGDYYFDEKKKKIRTYARVGFYEKDTLVSEIRGRKFLVCKVREKGKFTFFDQPFEIAPAGRKDKSGLGFAFIPSWSAIAADESISNIFYYDENGGDFLRTRKGMIENNLTPFDEIYAQEKNTKHIRFNEIQELTNKIVFREIMLNIFDIQNRVFESGETKYFHANQTVALGREVNHWTDSIDEKLMEIADVSAKAGATLRVTSGERICFEPGVIIEEGASLEAFIETTIDECLPNLNKSISEKDNYLSALPLIDIEVEENHLELFVKNTPKWAKSKDYQWEVFGNGFSTIEIGKNVILTDLPVGQYTAICSLFNGERVSSKIFKVQKNKPDLENRESDAEKNILQAKPKISIFPNPTAGTVNLIFQIKNEGIVNITISDVIGKKKSILLNEFKKQGNFSSTFDCSYLDKGIYFLIININGEMNSSKILIQ